MNYDVFICHASEDKEGFVDPLARALREAGVKASAITQNRPMSIT